MKFKTLRNFSFLGLVSLTLVACGSKPKSIACDGLNFFGPISFRADQEKIVIYDGELPSDENAEGFETIFADESTVTVEGSKIIINDNDPMVEDFLGKGPYELSLKTCPTGLTPAVQYFIP